MKRRGPMRWQPRGGGAIVAPDPRAVLAIAATPRERAGLAIALPMSLALHAGVLGIALREPAPVAVAPSIEVSLLREPEPAPPTAPSPVPAARPRPAPQAAARPTPPGVAAVAKPAPLASPTPVPVAEAPSAGQGAETAPAPVAAAPPSGEGGSGGTADPLESYVASVLRRIEARKRYPSLARSRGIEGTVVVTLWISPVGALDRLEVGGDAPPLLVGSTREAIERASPFPPPPAGLPSIRVPIRYALR